MALPDREWRGIAGYEGLYEVSDLGEIRSMPRHSTRGGLLKTNVEPRTGYFKVRLSKLGKVETRAVHDLVCQAFHGPRVGKVDCRHLDDDKLNNRAGNLQWGTRKENEADKISHGKAPRGEGNGRAKLREDQVIVIRQSAQPASVLAERFAVNVETIYDVRRGKTWKHLKPIGGVRDAA